MRGMYYFYKTITIESIEPGSNERPLLICREKCSMPVDRMPSDDYIKFDWHCSLADAIKRVENREMLPEDAFMNIPEVSRLKIFYDYGTNCATVNYRGRKINGLLSNHKYAVLVRYSEYVPTLEEMMNKPFDEVVKYAIACRETIERK